MAESGGIETDDRDRGPPRIATAAAHEWRGMVLAFVTAAVGLSLAVVAFNALADPWGLLGTGLLPTAVEDDRHAKLQLVDELHTGTAIVVLGSSRARTAEPTYLRRLTGERAFNAAVTSGDAADAWVFVRRIGDRFPDDPPRLYLWFIDWSLPASTISPLLAADTWARPYLPGTSRLDQMLDALAGYLSTDAARDSLRVVAACVRDRCRGTRFGPQGGLPRHLEGRAPRGAVRRSVALHLRAAPARPQPRPELRRRAVGGYFERTLASMNAHGSEPVIVINPKYPSVLRALERHGVSAAHRSVLRALRRRYRLRVVDLSDIATFGGSAADFQNATHVSVGNMRRMLRYVVAHERDLLGGRPLA